MLSCIRNKVDGSEKVFKEMKEDVCTLKQTFTSYLVSIKDIDTKIGSILIHFDPRPKEGLTSNTMDNPKNKTLMGIFVVIGHKKGTSYDITQVLIF